MTYISISNSLAVLDANPETVSKRSELIAQANGTRVRTLQRRAKQECLRIADIITFWRCRTYVDQLLMINGRHDLDAIARAVGLSERNSLCVFVRREFKTSNRQLLWGTEQKSNLRKAILSVTFVNPRLQLLWETHQTEWLRKLDKENV